MRNPGSFGAGALALILISVGCEAPEPEPDPARGAQAAQDGARVDLEAEEQAIREADEAMLEAARNRDAAGFADAFAPDGRLMFPYGPTAEGPEEIQAQSEESFGAPGFEVTWTTESIDIAESGDMAFSTGRYNLGMETPDGTMEDEGKFLTVWEKVDGEWKVAADMIATDQPPPGAGSPES